MVEIINLEVIEGVFHTVPNGAFVYGTTFKEPPDKAPPKFGAAGRYDHDPLMAYPITPVERQTFSIVFQVSTPVKTGRFVAAKPMLLHACFDDG